jgi:uncharacterized SAM-binding protein YcdF (DUF218 family)
VTDDERRPLLRRSWVRRTLAGVVLVVMVGFLYYAVSLFQVWSTGRGDQTRPVDAIVVLGAAQYDGRPSPQLASRLDHAVALWEDGVADLVVVTGGKQPGDRFTEAAASASYLEDRGVPASAIIREDEGRNSYESIDAASELLESRGLDRVLLVSDPFHSLRIRLIAEELGLEAYTSPTRTSPLSGRSSFLREMKEAAGVAVGRIIGFDRLTALSD